MTELVRAKSSEDPHVAMVPMPTPTTPPRPTYVVDVTREFSSLRDEGLARAQESADLRARVKGLETRERAAGTQRTAMSAAVIASIITALGAVVVVLFGRGG